MVNLVKSLKAAGVPIDGVGFQCHFIVGEVSTSLSTVMSQITALGLEVAITELDIRMTLPSTAALLSQQQTDYENVIKQCAAVAGCIGVSIWDFTDKVRFDFSSPYRVRFAPNLEQYSWVPQTFSGQGAALPWDQVRHPIYVLWKTSTYTLRIQNLAKKPAYNGITAGF